MSKIIWQKTRPEQGDPTISVSIIKDDGKIHAYNITEAHPRFGYIDGYLSSTPDLDPDHLLEAIDLVGDLGGELSKVSSRASVRGNQILFDGRPIAQTLADAIIEFADQGKRKELKRLVRFAKRVEKNPSAESRENLYAWMRNGGLRFDKNGFLIAYKGVNFNPETETYESTYGGKSRAFVNGVPRFGKIPVNIGDVVTMPREEVDPNSGNTCSVGLHFGTQSYAADYGDYTLSVKIDPRDVVAVPNDVNRQKVRTCKYVVVDVMDNRYEYTGIAYDGPDDYDTSDDEDDDFYSDESMEFHSDDDEEYYRWGEENLYDEEEDQTEVDSDEDSGNVESDGLGLDQSRDDDDSDEDDDFNSLVDEFVDEVDSLVDRVLKNIFRF